MTQPPIPPIPPIPPLYKPKQALDKDFVCRQILEVADLAREGGKLRLSLEALSLIAEIQGMCDDADSF